MLLKNLIDRTVHDELEGRFHNLGQDLKFGIAQVKGFIAYQYIYIYTMFQLSTEHRTNRKAIISYEK